MERTTCVVPDCFIEHLSHLYSYIYSTYLSNIGLVHNRNWLHQKGQYCINIGNIGYQRQISHDNVDIKRNLWPIFWYWYLTCPCRLGICAIGNRDCRMTAWFATINPLTCGIGLVCLSKVWRPITFKFFKISYSTEIARATVFNFMCTPLKLILSAQ